MKWQLKKNILMGVVKMNLNVVNLMWAFIGVIVVGGIYCLSVNNVDETVLSEGKKITDYVRTVLK